MKPILFLCTGNSCRSQMAEGFMRSFDPTPEVCSAGTQPASCTHPYAVKVMQEVGIDIAGSRPKSVNEFLGETFDHVITVCDDPDEHCPTFTGEVAHRAHLGFPDPARAAGTEEEILAVFRNVRDEIKEKLTDYYWREIKGSSPPRST